MLDYLLLPCIWLYKGFVTVVSIPYVLIKYAYKGSLALLKPATKNNKSKEAYHMSAAIAHEKSAKKADLSHVKEMQQLAEEEKRINKFSEETKAKQTKIELERRKQESLLEARRLKELEEKKKTEQLMRDKARAMAKKNHIDQMKKTKIDEKKIRQIEEQKERERLRKMIKEKEFEAKMERRRLAQEQLKVQGSFSKRLKVRFDNWYNNLNYVKHRKNQLEMKKQVLMIDFDSEENNRSDKKQTYSYIAKSSDGKIEKSSMDAFSRAEVHSFLVNEGYEVYDIKLSKIQRGNGMFNAKNRRIRKSDLSFYLTQISTYIKAGIPLADAIKILSNQMKKLDQKQIWKNIIYELTMGTSFSESLEKQGTTFPKLLVNMVKTAEMTGNLAETLDDMADYYTSVERTRKQMISAMTYPAVISFFAILIVIFIMIWVVPQFVDIYSSFNGEIPLITTYVIGISDFLENNIIYVIVGIIGVLFVYKMMFDYINAFKATMQYIFMHIPVVKNIIIYNEITMFTKTFGSLINHNIFITDSMEILSKITENEIYKMLIFDTVTNLAKGESISESFKGHWAFPNIAYQMLVTGEKTGQLGTMMNKVAEYYQEQHKNSVNSIKTFIEPIMIVFLAGIVGLILLSVILPMFNLYSSI